MTRIHWKFVIATDVMALVISLTSGLLGGVGLGILGLRALFVLGIFSVLAIGIDILIGMIFPEILSIFATENGDDSIDGDDMVGTKVDVLADDDDDLSEGGRVNDFAVSSFDNGDANAYGSGNARSGGHDIAVDSYKESRERKTTGANALADTISSEFEPSEMAKAVYTVMNKDNEG